MTAELFQEWVIGFDLRMRRQNRRVILLLDNFSGHTIAYQPSNVRIEFFSPNLTPYVQPMDAGAIRTFKALYHYDYCLRAIDLDEAGQQDIYKIDLLKAILMAKSAWSMVKPTTLENCWLHTEIQGPKSNTSASSASSVMLPTPATSEHPVFSSQESVPALQRTEPWDILHDYAFGKITTLPEVETRLQTCLGSAYISQDWIKLIGEILATEDDAIAAVEVYERLRAKAIAKPSIANSYPSYPSDLTQLRHAETSLMASVEDLITRKRIIGTAPTLEDLLNPIEETKAYISCPEPQFNTDKEIISEVRRRMEGPAIEDSNSECSDSDLDLDLDLDSKVTFQDGQELCLRLEKLALEHAEGDAALTLTNSLRKFRGDLFKKQMQSAKQATLHAYMTKK